jgi:hypothetical protein
MGTNCAKDYTMRGFIWGKLWISAVLVCLCSAAPEPAVVPGPDIWTLNVRFEQPEQIMFRAGNYEQPERFWYVILTLTNNTAHDVDFYPKCELMTDTFEIIPAGYHVPPAVFEQIKNRHRAKYPLLEPLEDAGCKMLQGADNAKDVVAIWHDFDAKAKNIMLFIGGLSNETAVFDHPVAKDNTGKTLKVFLRKTLELNYSLGGDPAFRSDVKLLFTGNSWIMR